MTTSPGKPRRQAKKGRDRDRMTMQHTEAALRNQTSKYHAELDPVKRRPKR
jgi:hypothetical protein